jgi:hypothetical protein
LPGAETVYRDSFARLLFAEHAPAIAPEPALNVVADVGGPAGRRVQEAICRPRVPRPDYPQWFVVARFIGPKSPERQEDGHYERPLDKPGQRGQPISVWHCLAKAKQWQRLLTRTASHEAVAHRSRAPAAREKSELGALN